jgi:recombination associated protein RdgC
MFKNLRIFKATQPLDEKPLVDVDSLVSALKETPFTPCLEQQARSIGWVSPVADELDEPALRIDQGALITLQIEEKMMPTAAVKENIERKVKEIESAQGRKVGRKEKGDIRDQVVLEMLPKAFSKIKKINGFYLPSLGLVAVDSASANLAEDFITELRAVIGSLPVRPLAYGNTRALLDRLASTPDYAFNGLEVDDACVMQGEALDGGRARKITIRGVNDFAKDVDERLSQSMHVTRLGLNHYQEKTEEPTICVNLNEDLSLSSVSFPTLPEKIDELEDLEFSWQLAKFQSDFALKALGHFLDVIKEHDEAISGPIDQAA